MIYVSLIDIHPTDPNGRFSCLSVCQLFVDDAIDILTVKESYFFGPGREHELTREYLAGNFVAKCCG
jgi:hypothetical protein